MGVTVLGNPLTCSISIAKPVVPTVLGYCPKSYPSLTGVFSVFKITNVINYKFIFTEVTAPFTVKEVIIPQSPIGAYGQMSVLINNPALALQMNRTYDVDVYAEYFDVTAGTNLYGNVFANCQITIGVPSKKGTDIQEFNNLNALTVYPNPSNGIITLSNTINFENASVKIYNALGQIVLSKESISGNDVNFDFSNHTSGIYIVEFQQGDYISRIKLIKE